MSVIVISDDFLLIKIKGGRLHTDRQNEEEMLCEELGNGRDNSVLDFVCKFAYGGRH
ncbi:hypothetical protein [Nitrospirillum viridazoti]|uniref:hypothetical protein n=1 Tax=Nitrospirillum viridazoti TaxID=3144925 RepID=UPI0002E6C5DF|nr:hypothetical protein [Nitrospirillum amazonense]